MVPGSIPGGRIFLLSGKFRDLNQNRNFARAPLTHADAALV